MNHNTWVKHALILRAFFMSQDTVKQKSSASSNIEKNVYICYFKITFSTNTWYQCSLLEITPKKQKENLYYAQWTLLVSFEMPN